MNKKERKLMSIGEVAKSLNLTRRIILNYEAKGLLIPDKKDGDKGNRYYSADSVSRVRTIRILQNLGISLDDMPFSFLVGIKTSYYASFLSFGVFRVQSLTSGKSIPYSAIYRS